MKKIVLLLGAALLNIATLAAETPEGSNPDVRQLAREAYFEIEDNVFSAERLRSAANKLEKAYSMEPNEPFIYLSSSLVAIVVGHGVGIWYKADRFARGALDNALESAKKALELDPNLAHTHAHLARIYITRADFDDARAHLDRAKALDPSSFYYWYFEGILAEIQEDAHRAYRFFDEAETRVTRKSQLRLISNHRGNVASILGDSEAKESLLLDDIRNYPSDANAYNTYGAFLSNNGRVQEAIVQYEKAVELGAFPLLLRNMGSAYNKLGEKYQNGKGVEQDQQKAVEFYRKGAELGNPYAMGNTGFMYEKGFGVDQDYGEAVRWYEQGANLENRFSQAKLGYLYLYGLGVDRDIEGAKRWYLKAVDNGYAKALFGLGAVYEEDGDYPEAIKWYRKAATQGVDHAADRITALQQRGYQ